MVEKKMKIDKDLIRIYLMVVVVLIISVSLAFIERSTDPTDPYEERITQMQQDINSLREDQDRLREDLNKLKTSHTSSINVSRDLSQRISEVEGRKTE